MTEPPDLTWRDFLFWMALAAGILAMGLTIGIAAALMI